MLQAKPVVEFVERDRELSMLAQGAPRQISQNHDGQMYSVAGAYEAARKAHRDDHEYPAGLVEAVGGAMLGRAPGDPRMAELVNQIVATA